MHIFTTTNGTLSKGSQSINYLVLDLNFLRALVFLFVDGILSANFETFSHKSIFQKDMLKSPMHAIHSSNSFKCFFFCGSYEEEHPNRAHPKCLNRFLKGPLSSRRQRAEEPALSVTFWMGARKSVLRIILRNLSHGF